MVISPSKKAIAKELGLDRSTVSKILNGYDVEKFAPETVARVREAADSMGYARAQRRVHARKPVRGLAEIRVYLEQDGSLFTQGLVYIRNLSQSGMLVDVVDLDRKEIPLAPFHFELDVKDSVGLSGLTLRGRPVRLADGVDPRLMGLGIAFRNLDEPTRKSLREYLTISLN
ncbi:MAG: PilZ domain-containing protein [Planctomycetes bacterium]|nr:PilZ domain-containing protein [Planctomycetota bacterium]